MSREPATDDVPQARDGCLQIDSGARLWCNDDVVHHIDGEVVPAHVLFYEVGEVELYFDDLELHSNIEVIAYDISLDPLFREHISYEDLESMLDMRESGWAYPVTDSPEAMQSEAIENYHGRSDQE